MLRSAPQVNHFQTVVYVTSVGYKFGKGHKLVFEISCLQKLITNRQTGAPSTQSAAVLRLVADKYTDCSTRQSVLCYGCVRNTL